MTPSLFLPQCLFVCFGGVPLKSSTKNEKILLFLWWMAMTRVLDLPTLQHPEPTFTYFLCEGWHAGVSRFFKLISLVRGKQTPVGKQAPVVSPTTLLEAWNPSTEPLRTTRLGSLSRQGLELLAGETWEADEISRTHPSFLGSSREGHITWMLCLLGCDLNWWQDQLSPASCRTEPENRFQSQKLPFNSWLRFLPAFLCNSYVNLVPKVLIQPLDLCNASGSAPRTLPWSKGESRP